MHIRWVYGAACAIRASIQACERVYVVPEHFDGWMCVDFDVKAAPPLPREQKALVVRPRPGVVLEPSDQASG